MNTRYSVLQISTDTEMIVASLIEALLKNKSGNQTKIVIYSDRLYSIVSIKLTVNVINF